MLSILSIVLSLSALALGVYNFTHSRGRSYSASSTAAQPAPTGEPVAVAPDPWEATIRDWLATGQAIALTPDAILAGALPGTPATRPNIIRLGRAMQALGYRGTRVRLPDKETPVRVFQPTAGAPQ